jgi:hypothetical protein
VTIPNINMPISDLACHTQLASEEDKSDFIGSGAPWNLNKIKHNDMMTSAINNTSNIWERSRSTFGKDKQILLRYFCEGLRYMQGFWCGQISLVLYYVYSVWFLPEIESVWIILEVYHTSNIDMQVPKIICHNIEHSIYHTSKYHNLKDTVNYRYLEHTDLRHFTK